MRDSVCISGVWALGIVQLENWMTLFWYIFKHPIHSYLHRGKREEKKKRIQWFPLTGLSFSSRYRTKSSIVQTFNPKRLPNLKHESRRIIPILPASSGRPCTGSPSSTNSAITAAGDLPARRQRSTAASVCPRRSRTPPTRARSGKTCPGRRKCSGRADGSARRRQVRERSWAEIPVVTVGSWASTEMVYAVRMGSSLLTTMRGRSSSSAREGRMGAQI